MYIHVHVRMYACQQFPDTGIYSSAVTKQQLRRACSLMSTNISREWSPTHYMYKLCVRTCRCHYGVTTILLGYNSWRRGGISLGEITWSYNNWQILSTCVHQFCCRVLLRCQDSWRAHSNTEPQQCIHESKTLSRAFTGPTCTGMKSGLTVLGQLHRKPSPPSPPAVPDPTSFCTCTCIHLYIGILYTRPESAQLCTNHLPPNCCDFFSPSVLNSRQLVYT